ncbi:MAG: sugar ABC transporter substrate-binding protein [Salinarimonas sp.]
MRKTIAFALASVAGAALMQAAPAAAQETTACLITKTDANPFFVKMREGAAAAAAERGIELQTYAGRIDGDVDSQIQAIESCIAAGAKGILITPSDSAGLVPLVEQARGQGILVIALDTPFEPASAADATFATDNREAGRLIGKWAAAQLGDAAADARIVSLDLNAMTPSVDYLRNQGFLEGFGVDVKDPDVIGDEDDPRYLGRDVTNGNEEGGRTAMESLLQAHPDLNVVYTINEPAAAGAYEALRAVGREDDVLVVSVDGGCPGVRNVEEGIIGATSMQFPLLMASLGIEAIAQYAQDGTLPEPSPGLDFFDTGVELVTDQPVEGIESMTAEEGLDRCWG